MFRTLAIALAALVAAGVVAGAAAARTHATVLHISALASGLKYSKTHLTATAGSVTIVMKNLSTLRHDVSIKGHGVNVKGKIVGKGGTSTAHAKLKKGVYTFYCSVDGHAVAGMKGTLTVR